MKYLTQHLGRLYWLYCILFFRTDMFVDGTKKTILHWFRCTHSFIKEKAVLIKDVPKNIGTHQIHQVGSKQSLLFCLCTLRECNLQVLSYWHRLKSWIPWTRSLWWYYEWQYTWRVWVSQLQCKSALADQMIDRYNRAPAIWSYCGLEDFVNQDLKLFSSYLRLYWWTLHTEGGISSS